MAKHHIEHHHDHAKGGHVEIHHHHHKKGGRVHRAKGGRTLLKAAGNPDVFKEAAGEEDYSRKKGGRAKHHRRDGGAVQMSGGSVRPRLDRPGRKRGGRVGSDTSPLTSAHNVHASEAQPNENDGD